MLKRTICNNTVFCNLTQKQRSYHAVEWVEGTVSSWYNQNVQEAKEKEKKVFCWCFVIIYHHPLWSYCAGFGCVSLAGNVLLKWFINKAMAFIKFFMLEWILNFGMYSPEATLKVQLSKHNDLTGDKMMTVFATLSIPWSYLASWGFYLYHFF